MASVSDFLDGVINSDSSTLDGESAEDQIDWRYTRNPNSHVGQVAWKRDLDQVGETNAFGTLYIRFSSGGYPREFEYERVPYRVFYYIWRGALHPGKYVYWTFLGKSGYWKSGHARE